MDAVNRVLGTAELVSIVFSFIKEDKGKWKGDAARLAIVDRFFCDAAISIVWEEMDSFEPFCSILVPSKDLSASTSFDEDAWKRFNLYSAKTKTLILNSSASLSSNPCWAFFMGTSSSVSTQGNLFPSLRTLCLNSTDTVSLSIAFSVCPYVKVLSVHAPPTAASCTEEVILSLAMALSRQARSLVAVQLPDPIHPLSLHNLLTIKTLRHVTVFITGTDQHLITPSFWGPSFLSIAQAYPGSTIGGGYTTKRDHCVKELLQRKAYQIPSSTLRTLRVSGMTQLYNMLADHPCAPAPSQRFDVLSLELQHPRKALLEHPLTAATMAKFINRNLKLRKLVIHGTQKALPDKAGQGLTRARTRHAFRNTGPLLDQLAASRNLTTIRIEGIYFPGGDIVDRILDVLQGSPNLVNFRFLPVPLSTSVVDAFTGPPISCLKDISTKCPNLVDLAFPVDLFDLSGITLPADVPLGAPKMQKLRLASISKDLPKHTVGNVARIAQYLYRLFPSLSPMASQWKEGQTAERAFWQDIDVIYSMVDSMGKK